MTRPRQKVVWSNPAAQQQAGNKVHPNHLGRFTQPAARPFPGEEPETGSLWFTKGHTWLITGAWDGTEAEDQQMSYLSPNQYRPSHMGNSSSVDNGTMLVYLGLERVTEWDGKGWARPLRPVYVMNGIKVAVTVPNIVRQA